MVIPAVIMSLVVRLNQSKVIPNFPLNKRASAPTSKVVTVSHVRVGDTRLGVPTVSIFCPPISHPEDVEGSRLMNLLPPSAWLPMLPHDPLIFKDDNHGCAKSINRSS